MPCGLAGLNQSVFRFISHILYYGKIRIHAVLTTRETVCIYRAMFESFEEIVRAWPSTSVLAADLGQGLPAVKQWRRRNSIPLRHWNALIAAAEARGIVGIELDLLFRLAAERTAA
jgi:hypothetical protein